MDIRSFLFEPLETISFVAEISATENGILAGTELTRNRTSELQMTLDFLAQEGTPLNPGDLVLRIIGSAEDIARAEEELLACVGKSSGVATAAQRFLAQVDGRAHIVCGAWKKIAPELRTHLRKAIAVGGAGIRLLDEPFVYLDKNYVRMFGSVRRAVERARGLDGRVVAVQVRGDTNLIAEEACQALNAGAGAIMVDTGNIDDLRIVADVVDRKGFRNKVKIAFAGGVNLCSIDDVVAAGAEIIEVGREIIDAPILDFRLDVIGKA
ncbi:MAG: nicotinate-nucleotide pyrophosphorylase [Desulfomonilaceae bacterium]